MKPDIRLYGILDPQIAAGRSLAALARKAAEGGATILQYRAKQACAREMIAEAAAIHLALEGTGVPLLINDRVDVALAIGAEGVHVGRDDMEPRLARKLLGASAIIGATIKNLADLERLTGQQISYGCIGGVFPTSHKDNPDAPVGIDGFRALRTAAREKLGAIPVGAIAGITLANAPALMQAGADGIAVIGALFAGADPAQAAREFRRVL
jgi:thiamine-phosphate pyrophosphorylase